MVQWTSCARADVTEIFLVFPHNDRIAAAVPAITFVFIVCRRKKGKIPGWPSVSFIMKAEAFLESLNFYPPRLPFILMG